MKNLSRKKTGSPKSHQRIAAVVPALNEELNVENVLKVLMSSEYLDEIILVDDGSADKTAKIGEQLGVKVIRLSENSGKGNAMRRGVDATDAEIIVFFDADLIGLTKEHAHLLIEPMLKGEAAMCVGIRDRLWGFPKLFAKMDPLLAIGGERAVTRDLFKNISDKSLQNFAAETALNHYCLSNKLSVEYVTLKEIDVIAKEKKQGFIKGTFSRIKMIFQIIKIRLKILIHKNEF